MFGPHHLAENPSMELEIARIRYVDRPVKRSLRTPTKEDTDSDEKGHFGVRGRERAHVDEVSALNGHGTRIGASFRYSW